jgi:hypothetical protein
VKYVLGFFRFWYDFVVGDDWRVAAGLAVAFGVSALLAHHGVPAWWFLPPAAIGLLGASLWREVRRSSR